MASESFRTIKYVNFLHTCYMIRPQSEVAVLYAHENEQHILPESAKCRGGCGPTGTLTPHWHKRVSARPLWNTVRRCLLKLNICTHRGRQLQPRYVPPEMHTCVAQRTRTGMIPETLFASVRIPKLKCLSIVDPVMKKVIYYCMQQFGWILMSVTLSDRSQM